MHQESNQSHSKTPFRGFLEVTKTFSLKGTYCCGPSFISQYNFVGFVIVDAVTGFHSIFTAVRMATSFIRVYESYGEFVAVEIGRSHRGQA